MKNQLMIILVLFLVSCSNGKQRNNKSRESDSLVITKSIKEKLSDKDKIELAKSVGIDTTLYIDFVNVLHSNKHCKGIAKYGKARPLKPVQLLRLNEHETSEICSRCINSEAMWTLDEIAQGYKETEVEIK